MEEGLEGRLEVTDGNALVDQQAFDLVEHRRVAEIRIATVDPPGNNDPNRRFSALHHPRLHRRCMGAEKVSLGKVEGVLIVTRRVIGGQVQGLEVVEVVLDLGTGLHGETHLTEDPLELPASAGHRVQGPAPRAPGGQANVGTAPFQFPLSLDRAGPRQRGVDLQQRRVCRDLGPAQPRGLAGGQVGFRDDEEAKARLDAIGESNRMTLKFRKPEQE